MSSIQPHLLERSRLGPVGSSSSQAVVLDWAVLAGCGVAAAAASVLLDFSLRLPGHAILRAIVPIGLGLALVPKRASGTRATLFAVATACLMGVSGRFDVGFGALTSLALAGPLLDVAARRRRNGPSLYLAFGLAGMATNLAALLVRGAAKWYVPTGRPFGSWLLVAAWSYPLCGFAAGVVAAAIGFRLTARRDGDDGPRHRELES